ncbi:FAD/NAD(P)-binding protein [Kibdelosporangium persicum]|uniref:FAD-dependent urate hydroxylase HpyO/Asp monooxygenase CreE-like FAD/NAD(P)-binding domain-containing protein n=1 Tax=Kibdelosporangium persicum TaxID=2698649 RepID=A0ABX2FFH7_9PSEU|nr:FAD/NAD(P)-binding protein [Kibdelosporangium persicum]NRN70042.1 hypothetical protein [Kibdelosporangium persicum]
MWTPVFPVLTAYAPRSVYGRYLRFVLDVVETNLPPDVRLVRVHGLVGGIEKRGDRFELVVGDEVIVCDQVAVCSGHPREQAERTMLSGRSNAQRHQRAGSVIGILGLGLTFHDAVAMLTVGRGGRFVGRGPDCEYIPGGQEPALIVAGSRSALPV